MYVIVYVFVLLLLDNNKNTTTFVDVYSMREFVVQAFLH